MAHLSEALSCDVLQFIVPHWGKATKGTVQSMLHREARIQKLWAGLRGATHSTSRGHLGIFPYALLWTVKPWPILFLFTSLVRGKTELSHDTRICVQHVTLYTNSVFHLMIVSTCRELCNNECNLNNTNYSMIFLFRPSVKHHYTYTRMRQNERIIPNYEM